MIVKRWLQIVGVAMVIASCCAMILERASIIYPTPETQSAFLKSYSPVEVIDRFKSSDGGQAFMNATSAAGRRFVTHDDVTHDKEFTQLFVTCSPDLGSIMTALKADISSKLVQDGRIVEQTGDSATGYQFKYEAGNGIGNVSVKPVEIIDSARVVGPAKLRSGEIAVSVRIVIAERWFPRNRKTA